MGKTPRLTPKGGLAQSVHETLQSHWSGLRCGEEFFELRPRGTEVKGILGIPAPRRSSPRRFRYADDQLLALIDRSHVRADTSECPDRAWPVR